MDNRSLDDFLDAGEDDAEAERTGETGDAGPDEGDASDAGPDGGDASDAGPGDRDPSDADDGTTVEGRAEQADASGTSVGDSTDLTNESVEDTDEGRESAQGPAGPDDGSVEPAVSTYVWGGAGGECTACGETVAERWHSEEGLVCRACKDW